MATIYEYTELTELTFKPELTETFYQTTFDEYRRTVRQLVTQYGSGGYGSVIRNAVSGMPYVYEKNGKLLFVTVGSAEETALFKVTDSTGRNGRRNSLSLYYNGALEYEQHQLVNDDDNSDESDDDY